MMESQEKERQDDQRSGRKMPGRGMKEANKSLTSDLKPGKKKRDE